MPAQCHVLLGQLLQPYLSMLHQHASIRPCIDLDLNPAADPICHACNETAHNVQGLMAQGQPWKSFQAV